MKSKKYLICDWCLSDGHLFVNHKAQSVEKFSEGQFHPFCYQKYLKIIKQAEKRAKSKSKKESVLQ